jgi:hypothetical protein
MTNNNWKEKFKEDFKNAPSKTVLASEEEMFEFIFTRMEQREKEVREEERTSIIKFIEENLMPVDAKNAEGIAHRHMAEVIRNYLLAKK